MAENSKIEWTDHTFNPWVGCAKVHAGCAHCYAETLMDHRYGKVQWGPNGTRVRTSDANWRKPLQWNRAAQKAGRPALVFCASLADVFEDRPELADWRRDLFAVIDATPNLIWLMLTKRPENVPRMWPLFYTKRPIFPGMPGLMGQPTPCVVAGYRRQNVWLGTSPCDQATADKAIPELVELRDLCGGTFLSCEPLLGEISFSQFPDWVITGGESGPGARPMHPDWVRSLRDQCQAAGVPFFFKQWGEFITKPVDPDAENGHVFTLRHDGAEVSYCKQGHTGDWYRLDPDQWRNIKKYPGDLLEIHNVGKKRAGRMIDGREWSQFPEAFKREVSHA